MDVIMSPFDCLHVVVHKSVFLGESFGTFCVFLYDGCWRLIGSRTSLRLEELGKLLELGLPPDEQARVIHLTHPQARALAHRMGIDDLFIEFVQTRRETCEFGCVHECKLGPRLS